MSDTTKGLLALVLACVIWGIAPILYKELAHIDAVEVLSHRIVWSLVFFGILLAVQKRLGALFDALRDRKLLLQLSLGAIFITSNWFLFIWAIQVERAVEASLGYYIFPLVAVVLGRFVFSERLTRLSLLALVLAGLAVLVLTYGLGKLPWISLVLASTFGLYGVVKKMIGIGSMLSVTAEVVLLAPLALIWLLGVHYLGWQGLAAHPGGFFGQDTRDTLLLMLSGPLTAGPLILFSFAAQRVALATVGLVQLLSPTLQFAVAVLLFREPFTPYHAIAFALIWVALALYSGQALARERAARRPSVRAGTSSKTSK